MKKVFLGIILGIGTIIPGVCTASLAIFLGVYESIVNFFSGRFSKKVFFDTIFIFIGMIIGIIITSLAINNFNTIQKNILMFFFYGFMIYGFKQYYQENIKDNFQLTSFTYGFTIIVLFQLVFSFLKVDINYSLTGIFIIGILVGIAVILPGLSGSMILLSFGVYYTIIQYITVFLKKFSINYNFFFILSFGSGLIVGIIMTSIIVKKLINKNSIKFSNYILGMIAGTIFIMTSLLINLTISGYIFIAVIMAFLGYLINKLVMKLN